MYKIILIGLLLTGCGENVSISKIKTNPSLDACKMKVYFDDCMKSLPAGPTSTMYNDWDAVVNECEDSSRHMAMRQENHIKDECKTGYAY